MMDILMSETCWAHNKWNKIVSDIKLLFYSSTIKWTSPTCSVHVHYLHIYILFNKKLLECQITYIFKYWKTQFECFTWKLEKFKTIRFSLKHNPANSERDEDCGWLALEWGGGGGRRKTYRLSKCCNTGIIDIEHAGSIPAPTIWSQKAPCSGSWMQECAHAARQWSCWYGLVKSLLKHDVCGAISVEHKTRECCSLLWINTCKSMRSRFVQYVRPVVNFKVLHTANWIR